MIETYTILLVEDNTDLWIGLKDLFKTTSYFLICVQNQSDALSYLNSSQIDLVLLDLILEEGSGKEILKFIRRQNPLLPIIVLSSLASMVTRKEIFLMGADDYLIKPYNNEELLMRLERLLEKNIYITNKEKTSNNLQLGDLTLDLQEEKIIITGKQVYLRNKLYSLMLLFMQNPNKVLRKETLHSMIWKNGLIDENSLNVHIHQLRIVIKTIKNPKIETISKVGYKLCFEE